MLDFIYPMEQERSRPRRLSNNFSYCSKKIGRFSMLTNISKCFASVAFLFLINASQITWLLMKLLYSFSIRSPITTSPAIAFFNVCKVITITPSSLLYRSISCCSTVRSELTLKMRRLNLGEKPNIIIVDS